MLVHDTCIYFGIGKNVENRHMTLIGSKIEDVGKWLASRHSSIDRY